MAFPMVTEYEHISNPGIVPKKLPTYCRQAESKGVKLKPAKLKPVRAKIFRRRLYTKAAITPEQRYAMAASTDPVAVVARVFNTTEDVVYKAKRAYKKIAQIGNIV